MDEVEAYVDAIDAEHRPLFDRIEGLIREVAPDVERVWSYKMPTYVVGGKRLHVAVWSHGLSLYGWQRDRDGGFADRHPDLAGAKGTLKLPPEAAAEIDDDELRDLFRAVLGA
jgi:uncharacterized protein YdhG (YjbR/CyaY superfamily)